MNKQPPAAPGQPHDSGKKSEKPDKRKKREKAPKVKREGPSRFKRAISAIGKRFFVIIICIVVVLAAAFAGAVITYRTQHQVWQQKLQQQEKQWLVDKRIELMERTIAMFSRGKVVKEMDEDMSKSMLDAAGKVSRDPTKIIGVISNVVKERSLSRCEVMESRSDFRSLLKLNRVLFGEKTQQAVDALLDENPWWNADSSLSENLLDAMAEDFFAEEYLE